jgi:hypothetical protein
VPAISKATANQAGRQGADLRIAVNGTDDNQSAFALDITLVDGSGAPVDAFGTMGSSPAGSERVVLFDDTSAVGQSSFSATVTLPGFILEHGAIASAIVRIVDDAGMSSPMTVPVTMQTVPAMGGACDPTVVASRCDTGAYCNPATSLCTAAAVPQLSKFAYVTSSFGARLLFAGQDQADDLSSIELQFFDLNNQPVVVDLTGNMDYQSSMVLSVYGGSTFGAFFDDAIASSTLQMDVPRLKATPSGSDTGAGVPVTATLVAPTVADSGAACDARGFVVCSAGESCIGTSCVATSAALDAAAQAATVLDGVTHTLATGYAAGPGLWGDPPVGCAPVGAHDLPEGVVTLHVAQDAASLTITTDNPETTMRSALFVLPGTGSQVGTQALGCVSGLPAHVSLTNVAAGDYTVVVAALLPGGGNFGVSIK